MCKIISVDIAADFVTDTSFRNILPILLQKKELSKCVRRVLVDIWNSRSCRNRTKCQGNYEFKGVFPSQNIYMASMDHLVQVVKANIWQLTFFLTPYTTYTYIVYYKMIWFRTLCLNQAVGSIQWTNTFDFKILKYTLEIVENHDYWNHFACSKWIRAIFVYVSNEKWPENHLNNPFLTKSIHFWAYYFTQNHRLCTYHILNNPNHDVNRQKVEIQLLNIRYNTYI